MRLGSEWHEPHRATVATVTIVAADAALRVYALHEGRPLVRMTGNAPVRGVQLRRRLHHSQRRGGQRPGRERQGGERDRGEREDAAHRGLRPAAAVSLAGAGCAGLGPSCCRGAPAAGGGIDSPVAARSVSGGGAERSCRPAIQAATNPTKKTNPSVATAGRRLRSRSGPRSNSGTNANPSPTRVKPTNPQAPR